MSLGFPQPRLPPDSWANPEQDIPVNWMGTGPPLRDLVGAGCGCQPEAARAAASSLELGRICAGRTWGSARSGGCSGWMAGDPVTRSRFGVGTHDPKTAGYFTPSNFYLLILIPVTLGTFVPRESHVVNASVSHVNKFP